jgi:hypothetical protein
MSRSVKTRTDDGTYYVTAAGAKILDMQRDRRPRGYAVPVPGWWIRMLEAAMAKHGISRAQLAERFSGTDDRSSRRFVAEKVRIGRFLKGEATTIEGVEELRGVFPELPQCVFFAASEDHARALARLSADLHGGSDFAEREIIEALKIEMRSLKESLDRTSSRVRRPGAAAGVGRRPAK